MARALILGLVTGFIATVLAWSAVRSSHFIYLPLVPQTPAIQQVVKSGDITYCLNQRAVQYPNFAAQVADVSANYEEQFDITIRRVDYGPNCQVKHDMANFECGGCAAHVYYANWPVLIEYKYTLGYQDWRTAIGHELGHALLGLHEQYDDSGGIGCTRRQDTVMDCASGVRYPQPLDAERACELVDVYCQNAAEPDWPQWQGYHWVFENGTAYVPSTGVWERLLKGAWVVEWGDCGGTEGWRRHYLTETWLRQGSQVWLGSDGLSDWSRVPAC